MYLRAKFYNQKHMQNKALKIKQTLDQKAPGAISFLNDAFKQASKKKKMKHEPVSVFKEDFKRLERVFGKNVF